MQIRDEAHRFGITFHRQLREKSQTKSVLSEIYGIGENTEIVLLQTFKSVENISARKLEELAAVIGQKRAMIVYNYFHKKNNPDDSGL